MGAHASSGLAFRAAAVCDSSIFMDRGATTDKICHLLREAARGGAHIIAFPESFLPGFPYWVFLQSLGQSMPWAMKMQDQAVDMAGPEIAQIAKVCGELGVTAVVGITEREQGRLGTFYNTNVVFGPSGHVLGKHRKLVPTMSEKQMWAQGDGSTIGVFDTPHGKLGTLCCGENVNTLARFALLEMGERIHVANFPSVALMGGGFADEHEMFMSLAPHAYEGKLFSIGVSEYGCAETARQLGVTLDPAALNSVAGVVGPDGKWINPPLKNERGIHYADCDLAMANPLRLIHEITGHYNKFDVFRLQVDRRPRSAVTYIDE